MSAVGVAYNTVCYFCDVCILFHFAGIRQTREKRTCERCECECEVAAKCKCKCECERKTIKIGFMVLFVFPQNDSMPQNWIIVLNYDYKVLLYRFNFMSAVGSSYQHNCNGLAWLGLAICRRAIFYDTLREFPIGHFAIVQ